MKQFEKDSTVNKVISVEIAKQVFWIDDDAYNNLKNYFENIREQLKDDECADDIYQDIELRVAELLFEFSPSDKKAITSEQLDIVIEQVGFVNNLDFEEQNSEVLASKETNRRAYLDSANKIVAGVCSGLSIRFKVPAFIIRVVFLALVMVFGLGIALYLIFWISLDKNATRYTALAAEGKDRTANELAKAEIPVDSTANTLQRILFLPFSIFGTLITVITDHFQKRKSNYIKIAKNVFAAGLFVAAISIFAGLIEFSFNRFFNIFITWILGFAVTYLILLTLLVYVKEYYMSSERKKVDKRLKFAAIVPVAIISIAIYSLNIGQAEQAIDVITQEYQVPNDNLAINFISNHSKEDHARRPVERAHYVIHSTNNVDNKLKVKVQYSSWGEDIKDARENTSSIDYQFAYSSGVLDLNLDWFLKPDTYSRGQRVQVFIEVPSNIKLITNRPLVIDEYKSTPAYLITYHYGDSEFSYYSKDTYLHEWDKDYPNKLSENELSLLQSKFCAEFFIGESWGCRNNIYGKLEYNYRFDQAFNKDIDKIAAIKDYLQPNRSLFVSNLSDIQTLLSELSVEYSVKSELQTYIEHLQAIKERHVKSLELASTE